MKGKLVVFEGIDGAGTETQSKLLLSHLKKDGVPAERIFYPDYDGELGKLIQQFLHKKRELSPRCLIRDRCRMTCTASSRSTIEMRRRCTGPMRVASRAVVPEPAIPPSVPPAPMNPKIRFPRVVCQVSAMKVQKTETEKRLKTADQI